jgi:hypothetical protein
VALRVACPLQEGPKAYIKCTLLRYADSGIVKISRRGAARATWHSMKCFCMQEDRRRLMLQRWEHTSARTGAAGTAARAVSLLPCMCVVPMRRNQAASNHQAAGKPLLVAGKPPSALAPRQAFPDAFPCLPVCPVCTDAASTVPVTCNTPAVTNRALHHIRYVLDASRGSSVQGLCMVGEARVSWEVV